VLRAESLDAELSIALVDDATIASLNHEWLDHEGPTDVISFPLYESGESPVGDVYVGVAQAIRQAADRNIDPAEEIVRLVVHGTLHVLGYDHGPEGRTRTPMWRTQERIVREVMT
jgi:probable rRNA maturation factor